MMLLPAACMTGVLHAEILSRPRVQARFDSLQFQYGELGESGFSPGLCVQWNLRLQCNPPWRVAYVRQDGEKPEVADSRGTRMPNPLLSFCTAENRDKSAAFRANLHIRGEKWRPAPRSVWMSVRGRIPVAVSCTEKLSEKVTLSLKDGEKTSIVLKGAALGKESDVRASVTVEWCRPNRWKGREGVAAVIRVKTPVPCGIKELEFFTEDGRPDDVSKSYEAFHGSYGQYYWLQNIWMGTESKDRFKMAVKYASGLQEVMVPVSFKAGMGGIVEPVRKGGEKKEGKK
ncbi:hypothetical protein [Akkermansia muciniphila]|uniref:hypothetical protein n=1 Tax=Akkermansia muciniphila TaxID=239935 RepID=UPI001BFF69C5|nr:hypothetical protein [Akkermansia muciniphila]